MLNAYLSIIPSSTLSQINRSLAMKPILLKFSEIPDFREQFKISNYLINS